MKLKTLKLLNSKTPKTPRTLNIGYSEKLIPFIDSAGIRPPPSRRFCLKRGLIPAFFPFTRAISSRSNMSVKKQESIL